MNCYTFDPTEQPPERKSFQFPLKKMKQGFQWLLFFFCPIATFYLTECFTRNPFSTMKAVPQLLNIAILELIMLLLFALFGNARAALMTETVFFMIFGLANYFVLDFRSAPVQPWDIFSVGVAATVAGNYEYKLDERALHTLLGFILLLFVEFFCRIRFTVHGKVKVWMQRTGLGILSALLFTGLTASLFSEKIVKTQYRLYDKLFTPTTVLYKNGHALSFLWELQYLTVDKPDDYEPKAAADLLSSYEPNPATELTKSAPNIIVIMDEAFSDPAVLGDFETNEDYMPFVHSMLEGCENTISGYLNVSIKGGNTANTEFEYLTGNSMAFLPQGSIPYQQYVQSKTPSIASHLASLGYETIAVHPYYASGWKRDTVYPNLGFETSYFIDFFRNSEIIRKYVSDKGQYEKIIELYENKEEGKPLFLFNVTMQNHSSYNDWNDYDNFTPNITVKDSDSNLLSAYLSLMQISDTAIEELVTHFSDQEEETLIVFFGDHQPTDSIVNPVLKLSGRPCSDLSEEEESLRYKVPFFIWANYDIEESTQEETCPAFLAVKTLKAAGLPLSDYFSFLDELNETVASVSTLGVTRQDGTFSFTKEEDELLNTWQSLQYYLLFDQED